MHEHAPRTHPRSQTAGNLEIERCGDGTSPYAHHRWNRDADGPSFRSLLAPPLTQTALKKSSSSSSAREMASIVTRAARAARAAGTAAAAARRAISSTAACRARYSSDPYAVPEDYLLPAEPVPGRDASTNYILAYADVPVNKRRLTYKNLSSRQLAGLAGKAAGKNGVFTASAGAGCARKVAGSTDQTGATTVSFEEADDIIDGVMSYLARTPALYVEDAMVGSASGSEIRVVGVTEDPASAAVLRAVLEKAPKSKMASKRPMKVYVAPGCPVEEPTALPRGGAHSQGRHRRRCGRGRHVRGNPLCGGRPQQRRRQPLPQLRHLRLVRRQDRPGLWWFVKGQIGRLRLRHADLRARLGLDRRGGRQAARGSVPRPGRQGQGAGRRREAGQAPRREPGGAQRRGVSGDDHLRGRRSGGKTPAEMVSRQIPR